MISKHFLVFKEKILKSTAFLVSKLSTGKIHLFSINLPIKEFIVYFGKCGNFFEINK